MYHILPILPGTIYSGFIVYLVLSNLLTPFRIIAPLSIIISIIVFGLTGYYYYGGESRNDLYKSTRKENHCSKKKNNNNKSILNLFFIAIYASSIIFVFSPHEISQVFIPWEQITVLDILKLAAAIILCLFAPGYALITSLDKRHELEFLPKFLLGYLFSVLVTGLIAYVISSIGISFLYVHDMIIAINLAMLGIFIYTQVFRRNIIKSTDYHLSDLLTVWKSAKKQHFSMLLVFTSLFALVIVFTIYLYNGTIIGDQWSHHGRALMFLSDLYKDFAASGISAPYPPLFSAFLAAFFDLSNIPSVNAYASVNFLNFMPVIAFYYFFLKWIPFHKKAGLLAITLFMLGSGYGWIYLLYLTEANHYTVPNPTSALEVLQSASIKTFDVWIPNTFIDVGHPDITSGLIIIALPAGFVLLGLVKEKTTNNKFIYFLIIVGVTAVGYLFHAEFGLFILVGTLLPLLFRLDNKSYFFAAILVALGLITLVDFLSPENYYRARTILFGFPFEMIVLYVLFVVSVWILYLSRILNKIDVPDNLPKIIKRKINKGHARFVLGVIIISLVSYLYILSFITWDALLPSIDIRIHTKELSLVPWYFYPMRLGITGLVALSFALSYIFRRFEKEIFVFGIIAIIAFLTGSYYSEVRFNKYIMASMAGLASILIYKMLTIRPFSKPIFGGLIIATIVISSSLSVLMYSSYIALGLENPNTNFDSMLPRRHFPSHSELPLINFLHSHLNPKKDNIVLPANELASPLLGSFATISSFGGIPETKLTQSPWLLQESTLEGLYTLLDYTNARFIVLPKQYIHDVDDNYNNNTVSDVLRFTLDNFQKAYENDKYFVLSIPPLAPPSNKGDIALVSPPSLDYYYYIPSINSSNTLDYNKDFVTSNNRYQLLQMGRVAALEGNKTVMSNIIQDNINYIESRFRVIGNNNTDNHGGIVWKAGDKFYYAFIRPDRRLSLETPLGHELISESVVRGKGKWFTLKVVDINGTFKIFLDDVLQISAPKYSANASISQVGIRSYNSGAQFESITIGKTDPSYEEHETSDPRYKYYYALSALALSKLNYSIFVYGDFSAFSKRNIILPYDPLHPGPYLEFAKNGGNVIVLNADKYLGGGFSKLLCFKPDNNEKQFDGIRGSGGEFIKASGMAQNIKKHCAGTITKSSYIRNGQDIAPFIVEKDYGNGKIIFANTYGYFTAVSKQPHELFLKIGAIMPFINVKGDQFTKKITSLNAIPSNRFVGNVEMSGQVVINSSSLILLDNDFYAEQVLMRPDQKEKNNDNLFYKSSPLLHFDNTHIRNLKLYGTYSVLANTNGLSYLPSIPSSLSLPPYGYINLNLPSSSDITIRLFNNESSADFFVGELPIKVTHREIEFNGVNRRINNDSVAATAATNSSDELKTAADNYLPVLMKNPEFKVLNGTLSFDELHSNSPYTPIKPWASEIPLQVKGKTILKLDHINTDVDNKSKHVTYFTWIEFHADANKPLVRSTGFLLEVPWRLIINSHINILVMVLVSVTAALTIYIGWSKPKLKKRIR